MGIIYNGVVEEAKIMASTMLKDPEKKLMRLEKSRGMAVSRDKKDLVGSHSFELEGESFFVGLYRERRM